MTRTALFRRFASRFAALLCVASLLGGTIASAQPGQSTPPSAAGAIESLRGLIGGAAAQPELLPPDEAFRIELRARDATTLVATLSPAAGYYLYRDRISFAVAQPAGIAIGAVELPPGEAKADPTFGTVQVYHQPFDALIRLAPAAGIAAGTVELKAGFQGCNDPLGVCYPPIDKLLTVALPPAGMAAAPTGAALAERGNAGAATSASMGTAALPANAGAGSLAAGSDEQLIRDLFANSRPALIAAFFGFGLLLAFTPCMLPMIPILSGLIVGHGALMTRRHALALSGIYVLGMAITYAAAGVGAGLAGSMLSAYLQQPWVLGGFAAIFVLLALSMFGFYELQLPAALQTRLSMAGRGIRGGRAAGAFLMGVLSAVIVGPCVAAPLAGALLYIGQTGDVVLGGAALFAMALGMGVPLLVVGATAGSLLPKAGPWMESVKRVFGVAMLATALYLLSPVLPIVAQQLLWAALLIVPAIFLHALDPLPPAAPGYRRLFKGIGVIALFGGAAMLVGALSGSRDMLQPLAGLRGGSEASARPELPFEPVSSVAELDRRLSSARGRTVMLDFWAEWCVSCKEMERVTFTDPQVRAALADVVLLRADVTANRAEHRALLARFSLFGPPGIVFFDKAGQELPLRVIGYQPPERFRTTLAGVAALAQSP